MVWYAQDGRRIYLTSVNPDEPGVYMVENIGGVDEPYTGDLEDLGVSLDHVSKLSPVELEYLRSQLDPHYLPWRPRSIRHSND